MKRERRIPAAVRRRRTAVAAAALVALVVGVVVGANAGGAKLDYRTAVASTFATYGDPLACGGTLQEGQTGAASKTLPCGTRVSFRLRGRTTTAPIIDRGPYVAGRDFDLTQATADALDFNGLGEIEWAVTEDK
jgi:rare lipoprotein A (peptidoglycan hydrolase)